MTEELDTRRRKLSFRAWHRGFKEADLYLGRFADAELAQMSAADLDAFEHLLEQPDQELYGWIIGRTETPAQFDTPMMARLQAFDPSVSDAT
jgi:antitoxin CptB